ncbi:hypothetical protein SLS62_005001 [Diatrype stigma]|uniref:Uncharacterized protein n=1 Tax=Diatrype stigma TaxID=117547 RepID=A0AAN9YQ23_9PEZI
MRDFADQFPSAEVIGVDISPPQPNWVPPNLKFEVDDVTLEWTYEPDSFDYVHMRWLVGAIPDWDELFRQVYRAVKPGGYFESKESSSVITSDDGTVSDGCALDQWGKVFSEAGNKFGRTFRVLEDNIQRKAMEAAGFVDIEEYNFIVSMQRPVAVRAAMAFHRRAQRIEELGDRWDVAGGGTCGIALTIS